MSPGFAPEGWNSIGCLTFCEPLDFQNTRVFGSAAEGTALLVGEAHLLPQIVTVPFVWETGGEEASPTSTVNLMCCGFHLFNYIVYVSK